jgi:hypothetical protein
MKWWEVTLVELVATKLVILQKYQLTKLWNEKYALVNFYQSIWPNIPEDSHLPPPLIWIIESKLYNGHKNVSLCNDHLSYINMLKNLTTLGILKLGETPGWNWF